MSCLNTITLEVLHVIDPLAEEILLASYASEDREFTEAAAAPHYRWNYIFKVARCGDDED